MTYYKTIYFKDYKLLIYSNGKIKFIFSKKLQ